MIGQYWKPKPFDTKQTSYEAIGSDRCFGLELEYSKVNGLDGCIPKIKDQTPFGAKYDCSVGCGAEFYSPILCGDEGLQTCITLCDIAKEHKFGLSNNASVHLHLDLRKDSNDSKKAMALGYMFTQEFWQGVVPMHRRCNHEYAGPANYTKHTLNRSWRDFYRSQPRYQWCNWNAYYPHKTVEIRSHEATYSGRDIAMWVKAHTRFCDAMGQLGMTTVDKVFSRKRTFGGIMQEMRSIFSDRSVSAYFTRRFNRFATTT